MVDTEKQRIVKSYVAGVIALLDPLQALYRVPVKADDLRPALVLLASAVELLEEEVAARERKNVGDRARRAKKKTAANPRPRRRRPAQPGAASGAGTLG